jgi:hypothetical protein
VELVGVMYSGVQWLQRILVEVLWVWVQCECSGVQGVLAVGRWRWKKCAGRLEQSGSTVVSWDAGMQWCVGGVGQATEKCDWGGVGGGVEWTGAWTILLNWNADKHCCVTLTCCSLQLHRCCDNWSSLLYIYSSLVHQRWSLGRSGTTIFMLAIQECINKQDLLLSAWMEHITPNCGDRRECDTGRHGQRHKGGRERY